VLAPAWVEEAKRKQDKKAEKAQAEWDAGLLAKATPAPQTLPDAMQQLALKYAVTNGLTLGRRTRGTSFLSGPVSTPTGGQGPSLLTPEQQAAIRPRPLLAPATASTSSLVAPVAPPSAPSPVSLAPTPQQTTDLKKKLSTTPLNYFWRAK
jgi:hypothetical protein